MPKAKVNKDRKEKVQQFKNQQKSTRMSEVKIPESPIAQQFPVWSSKSNIEMSGLEFEAIYNFLNNFRNAVMAGESVLQKNINNGTIKWVYKDKDGKDVPDEQVKAYQAEVEKFFAAQQAAKDQEGVPKLDSLVGLNGEELKSS